MQGQPQDISMASSETTGQPQMTNANQVSGNPGQGQGFLHKTGEGFMGMAQGATTIAQGAVQGAANLAQGAASGVSNITQGTASAFTNATGGSNNNAHTNTSPNTNYPTNPNAST